MRIWLRLHHWQQLPRHTLALMHPVPARESVPSLGICWAVTTVVAQLRNSGPRLQSLYLAPTILESFLPVSCHVGIWMRELTDWKPCC